LLWRPAQVFEG